MLSQSRAAGVALDRILLEDGLVILSVGAPGRTALVEIAPCLNPRVAFWFGAVPLRAHRLAAMGPAILGGLSDNQFRGKRPLDMS